MRGGRGQDTILRGRYLARYWGTPLIHLYPLRIFPFPFILTYWMVTRIEQYCLLSGFWHNISSWHGFVDLKYLAASFRAEICNIGAARPGLGPDKCKIFKWYHFNSWVSPAARERNKNNLWLPILFPAGSHVAFIIKIGRPHTSSLQPPYLPLPPPRFARHHGVFVSLEV